MKRLSNLISCLVLLKALQSCEQAYSPWYLEKSISLQDIRPVGITQADGQLWLADTDKNRMVSIDMEGKIKDSITGLERPMHIAGNQGTLYAPEYGADLISTHKKGERKTLPLPVALNAPAGVAILGNEIAIADFYAHSVHYFDGKVWYSFGQEGKLSGEFYYPTDVHITEDHILVADAYNHRIQLFDKARNHVISIGEDQKINAATGVFADDKQVYVTDFENSRLLIFDYKGQPLQVLDEGFDKPTDVLKIEGKLCVTNYAGKQISVLTQ